VRIFLAGASGVIGRRLIPLLVESGHAVAGMTRSVANVDVLDGLGADAVVCDVFDLDGVTAAVVDFAPELVIHQLTDLPDDLARIGEFGAANARIRREGTRNLLTAAASAGVRRLMAQSVAWELPDDAGVAVADMERMVLAANGVVLRYGQFYGPGTYNPDELPADPRIQIDRAAQRTVAAIGAASGIVTIVDG
jgi:nucleoside-diphosphate-sugar epimerase